MSQNQNQKAGRRVSVLDVLTLVVLASATFLLVRPGSALHASVAEWRRNKKIDAAVTDKWIEIQSRATLLYSGNGEPDIVEVLDYECPFCRASGPVVDSAVAMGLRVGILHFPIKATSRANSAALAALCLDEHPDEFARLHSHLLSTEEWRGESDSRSLVSVLPDSVHAPLNECVNSARVRQALDEHKALVTTLGVQGTPTFLSKSGALSLEDFSAARLLERATDSP